MCRQVSVCNAAVCFAVVVWLPCHTIRITTNKKTEVFVTLMQQDRRGPIALRDVSK